MNNPNYFVRDAIKSNNVDVNDQSNSVSVLYGTALTSSYDGHVEVKIINDGFNDTANYILDRPEGTKRASWEMNWHHERGISIPTTVYVESNQSVLILASGQTEKKMIVIGVVGGGDYIRNILMGMHTCLWWLGIIMQNLAGFLSQQYPNLSNDADTLDTYIRDIFKKTPQKYDNRYADDNLNEPQSDETP